MSGEVLRSKSRLDYPFNDLGEAESFLPQSSGHNVRRRSKRTTNSSKIQIFLADVFRFGFFLVSLSMFAYSVHWKLNATKMCWDMHTTHSSLTKDVNLEWKDVKFDASLNSPSIYRYDDNPPVPASVDAAWDRIVHNFSAYGATTEDYLKAGIPTDYMYLDAYFGGGFATIVEATHQLHCVNMLRKGLWYNHPYYNKNPERGYEFLDSERMTRTHINHCIEYLRQTLMCSADVGMIGSRWVKGYSGPYPDFSTWHKCRDFDSVMKAAYARNIPREPEGWEWKPRPGDTVYEEDP